MKDKKAKQNPEAHTGDFFFLVLLLLFIFLHFYYLTGPNTSPQYSFTTAAAKQQKEI